MRKKKKKKHKNQNDDIVKFRSAPKDRPYLILKRYTGSNQAMKRMLGTGWVIHKKYATPDDRDKAFQNIKHKQEMKETSFDHTDYEYLVLNIMDGR